MFLKKIIPALLWAIVIFILTCMKPSGLPHVSLWNLPADKFVHAFLFGVLAHFLVYGFAMQHIYKYLRSSPLIFAFLVVVTYGGVIELLQKYIFTWRSAEWWDWICDLLGALLVIVLLRNFYRKKYFTPHAR